MYTATIYSVVQALPCGILYKYVRTAREYNNFTYKITIYRQFLLFHYDINCGYNIDYPAIYAFYCWLQMVSVQTIYRLNNTNIASYSLLQLNLYLPFMDDSLSSLTSEPGLRVTLTTRSWSLPHVLCPWGYCCRRHVYSCDRMSLSQSDRLIWVCWSAAAPCLLL